MSLTVRIGGLIPIPFTIFRNDTNTVYVNIVESDGITPYDITGSVVTFAAKWAVTDTSEAISLSSSDSSEIFFTDPANGQLTITFSPTSTSSLPIGILELFYELRVTTASLVKLPASFGIIRVLPNVIT